MQNEMQSRTDDTIDFDHYRSVAGILRLKASIDIMRGAGPALLLAASAAAVLLVAVITLGSPDPARVAAAASAQTR